MTQDTSLPPDGILETRGGAASETRAHLDAILFQLRDIRTELQEVQADLRAGGAPEAARIAQIKTWIKYALEAEKAHADATRKDQAIARGDYALDLARARDALRCRFDRLRRCGG